MAYNHNTGLVDIFGGREDIDRKVIRCVGNPTERFTEDALRILRAIRFLPSWDLRSKMPHGRRSQKSLQI